MVQFFGFINELNGMVFSSFAYAFFSIYDNYYLKRIRRKVYPKGQPTIKRLI